MSDKHILLIYDKQCPACHFYCQMVRIRKSVGKLELLDARDGGAVMDEITAAGLDIDQGMVLKLGDALYYGADAIHMLSLLGSPSDMFNRINFWIFRFKPIAQMLYPILRFFRNLLLKILGKTKINNLQIEGNYYF